MTPKRAADWREVRFAENKVATEIRQRYSLWVHGLWLGLMTLGLTWGTSHVLMRFGIDSLALRYCIALSAGYIGYLIQLRIWAYFLLRPSKNFDGGDVLPDFAPGSNGNVSGSNTHGGTSKLPEIRTDGGGDFGGGGATGDFGSESGDALSNVAGSALEVAGAAEEGAVIVIPVVAIFMIVCSILLGMGSLLMLYFGWEVLLAVAIELSFVYVSVRVAVGVEREGWLSSAIRLTWKPLLASIFFAALVGLAIDKFIPQARTLPSAIKIIYAHLHG